jgi:hypothetical protein
MLHIHNGDCSANIAKESSLPGEQFAFRESLITGPAPTGLSDIEWRSVRAHHLSEAYGVDLEECEQALLDQEKTLASFAEHEEAVFWFEHDLFCQINLIYLLSWFARQELGNTKLSLICIGEFPGKENFRGLGELNSAQMASLFPGRQQVTSPLLKFAALAWEAYCSPNPTEIERVVQTGDSLLPFLGKALGAHLRRFPSAKNGLGCVEHQALELIHGGAKTFMDLFPRFGDAEPAYGLGDAQLWLALERMSVGRQPLLTIENGKNGGGKLTPEIVCHAKFEITESGELVLRGEADFAELNGIDLWLGGVHLSEDNLWRWDEFSANIVNRTKRI